MPGGLPAARLMDMHTCPMCMGAPFPILPPCALTVLIGKMPAARMGDLCACIIPALVPVPSVDAIVLGSPTVLIMGQPAARLTDLTVKGGLILPPCMPTVLIGMVGIPVITLPGGLGPIWVETLPDGTTVTHVGDNIKIAGDPAFQQTVVNDLATLYGTPSGRALIDSLNRGPHGMTIVKTDDGNECGYDSPEARFAGPDGTPGAGSASTVYYNPNRTQIGDGSEPWMTRPPAVGLGHEMVHADDASKGQQVRGETGGTRNRELQAVGLPPYARKEPSENSLRRDLGLPPRPTY